MSSIFADKHISDVALIFGGITLFVGAVFFIQSFSYSLHWVFISALFIMGITPYVYEYTQGNLDPFSPIMWIAPIFTITYGAGAARRILNQDFAFQAEYIVVSPKPVILEVLVLAVVGLVALSYGYYKPWGRKLAARTPRFRSGWSSYRAWVAIVVTTLLGLYGFWLLLPYLGPGPRSHLAKGSSRLAFVLINLLNVATILLIADTLISGVSYDGLKFEIYKLRKLVIIIPFMLLNVRILWMLGGRGRAFSVFVIFVFLYHYLVRRFSLFEGIAVFAGVKIIPSWVAGIVSAAVSLNIDELFYHLQNPYFSENPLHDHLITLWYLYPVSLRN